MTLFDLLNEISKLYGVAGIDNEIVNEGRECACKTRQLKCETFTDMEECAVFKTVLPMLKKENISIEISDGILRISLVGLKSDTEFVPKSYTREIVLPEHYGDNIEAKYEEGVLTIVIPKIVKTKPKTINIKIN